MRKIQVIKRFVSQRHEIFNQSEPFGNIDLFNSDHALQRSLSKMVPGSVNKSNSLVEFGKGSGSIEMMKVANEAEVNRPVLHNFDMYGRRIDVVEFHDSYHKLMDHGIRHGCINYGYIGNKESSHNHMARAALIYMENQLEPGHCCPIVMSAAAIPILRQSTELKPWLDKLLTGNYDPSNLPISLKSGITMGMSMTECQGGSDVRANTTIAKPLNPSHQGTDQAYLLRGHKWFTSAPMCDGFLTLSKTEARPDLPTCFLVPRWIPTDGRRNTGFIVSRLKNKLADRANASSEVEYHDAWGQMIGEEGRGVKTIIEMVQMTRLDCTLGSAGMIRRALQVALNHTSSRRAFGEKLINQPLMTNLLADLCVEAEASTLLAMRMAAAHSYIEEHRTSKSNPKPTPSPPVDVDHERELFRVGVAVSKYYVTKRQPNFTYECMEALGGNGFTEDFPLAKIFRHSPLNSIWEGSGNVIALDVLKAADLLPVLLKEIQLARGMDSAFDRYCDSLHNFLNRSVFPLLKDPSPDAGLQKQILARQLADRLALGLQGSLILRFGYESTAQAFLQSRLRQAKEGEEESFYWNYGSHAYPQSLSRSIIEDNQFTKL